ncbi:MAG: amidohydrolase family protein [Streptosporangiales bacterium]|nr:amidohydrolase family protein [Streptosporangiales bacterium]
MQDAVLIVEDGVVTEVASRAGELPADAVRLDDATVLPGLVDCHVHLPFDASADPVAAILAMPVPAATLQGVRNAQTILRHGVTTVRDVSSPHGISLAIRDAVAQEWVDGPDVRPCGTHLTITGGHGCAFGIEVDSIDQIRTAVRSQIKAGADHLKVMATGGVYSLRQTPEDVQFRRP